MENHFKILCGEAERFLDKEAGSIGLAHPGYMLRLLVCPIFLEGEEYVHWMELIAEHGFLPVHDLFNYETGSRRCSLASVARALRVSVPVAEHLVDKFLETEAAAKCGITRETLFPNNECECTLH